MPVLKIGSRGADVRSLQSALSLYVDGIFGPLTEEAVKKFQSEHGFSPDGIVGAKTWAATKSFFTVRPRLRGATSRSSKSGSGILPVVSPT